MTPAEAQNESSNTDQRDMTGDSLEESLHEGLADDERLQSGIPGDMRGDDLSFIQMTGLTHLEEVSQADAPPAVPAPEDIEDSVRPVSFYEEGVADVDSSMESGVETPEAENEELYEAPEAPAKSSDSMAELKNIIASLTDEESDDEAVTAASVEAVAEEATEDVPEAVVLDEPTPESEPVGQGEETPQPTQEPAEDPAVSEADEAIPMISMEQDAAPAPPAPEITNDDLPEPAIEQAPAAAAPTPPATVPRETPAKSDRPVFAYNAPVRRTEDEQEEKEREEPADFSCEEEGDDSIYRHPSPPSRARRSKHRESRAVRKLKRWALCFGLPMLVVGTGALIYWATPMQRKEVLTAWGMMPAENLLEEARGLEREGRHAQAAQAYMRFGRKAGQDDPHRADALFSAAYALQQVRPASPAEEDTLNEQSLELFQTFLADYPEHEKALRTTSLMATLHYELGQYEKALDLLSDARLRHQDPAGALPALRTLARSHARLLDLDAARSAYLQAASMPGNYTPDEDFSELAVLYQRMAEFEHDPDLRQSYYDEAVRHLNNAMKVPGISPRRRKHFETQRSTLIAETNRPEGLNGADGPIPAPVGNSPPAPATNAPVER